MEPMEKEDYPICLVACKSRNQPLTPEKGYQSALTSTSQSDSLKTTGSLQDFSSQVGSSGVIVDYQKGLVITTALPFAEFIPSEQGGRNDHQSNNSEGGLDNCVNHYSGNELKESSVSVILQSPKINEMEKAKQSFLSTRQSTANRHRPSANRVFSALPHPSKLTTSSIKDNATESFEVHDARVVLLWRCASLDDEMKSLMPSADRWELDYGEKKGEIGSSSHLMDGKDVLEDGDEEGRKDNGQRNLLSWFALLQVDGGLHVSSGQQLKIVPSTSLRLAQPVTACGTPFATLSPSIFYNSLSKGIITKHSGQDLVMTDARCMPGTEGGGLFVTDKKHRYLAAMIISPLCWKSNEWIGLTLACSMTAILDSLQGLTSIDLSMIRSTYHGYGSHSSHEMCLQNPEVDLKRFQSVVLLRVGTVWGSGVIVNEKEGLILTCRHLVKGASYNQVSVKVSSGSWMKASVLHTNPVTSPIDLAILKVEGHQDNASLVSIGMDTDYQEGSRVYAVGFPLFDPSQSSTPSVTSGVVSKVIRINQKPIMTQSTCAINAGASGGALLCAETGNLVGIIASNSRDSESGASFPHVNFSIPVECFRHAIKQYIITKDPSWFKDLELINEKVEAVWALEENGTYIRRLPSKL
eukprot:XP_003725875.1 PREDICTED: peroxisomal leader peptide-processing protease [Strongylocentrotus purpuratus]